MSWFLGWRLRCTGPLFGLLTWLVAGLGWWLVWDEKCCPDVWASDCAMLGLWLGCCLVWWLFCTWLVASLVPGLGYAGGSARFVSWLVLFFCDWDGGWAGLVAVLYCWKGCS